MGVLHFICSWINRVIEWRSSSWKLHGVRSGVISEPVVLGYFNPSKPVMLSVDASSSEWSWYCMLTGWFPCSLCRMIPNEGRNFICTNREGTAFCHICMEKIPWFYLWSASYYKPFLHSTSVHMNNSTRVRLGWTFSYTHCIFVRPNLASVPLFVGMRERSIAIVNKPLQLAPVRLQHMLLQLQKYDLKFIYKKGTIQYNLQYNTIYFLLK